MYTNRTYKDDRYLVLSAERLRELERFAAKASADLLNENLRLLKEDTGKQEESAKAEYAAATERGENRDLEGMLKYVRTNHDREIKYIKQRFEVKRKIECSDGSVIQFPSMEEIIQFRNPTERRIVSISLEVPGSLDIGGFSLDLGHSYSDSTVRATIKGGDGFVVYHSREFESYIKSLSPWFGFLRKINGFVAALIAALCVVLFFALKYIAPVLLSEGPLTDQARAELGNALISGYWLALLAAFIFGIGFATLRKRIFPRVAFATGEGKRRYERIQGVHKYLAGGVILAIIVSIAANILTPPWSVWGR